jgi:hypothetical protein
MSGNWIHAANGYWSPLISWLLIPLIALKIHALTAFKLISFLSGLLSINIMYHILNRVRVNAITKMTVILLMIPELLMITLRINTPDLLGFTAWLLVILQLLKLWNKPNYRNKMLLALLGLIAYFARYYHFYTFLGSSIIFLILGWTKFKKVNWAVSASLFVFIALSGIWMLVMDLKYNIITPTISADYNLHQTATASRNYPGQTGDTLLDLDYSDYHYTSWEEPSYYPMNNTQQSFSPLTVFSRIAYQLKPVIRFFFFESLLFVLALTMLLFRLNHLNSTQWLLFAIGLLYPVGYLWTSAEPRFFIFPLFVFFTLSIHAVFNRMVTEWPMKFLILFLLCLCMVTPVYRIIKHPNEGKSIKQTASLFGNMIPIKQSRIMCSPSVYKDAMYLSYFSDALFCDAIKPEKYFAFHSRMKERQISDYLCDRKELRKGMKAKLVSGNLVLVEL